MKNIYFIGDVINNNGPAIVNKSYKKYLDKKLIFCNNNNRIFRAFHFLIHIFHSKTIIVSGFSTLNYYLLKISKKLRKRTFYLMHGYVKEECKYFSLPENIKESRILLEKKIIITADKIICVSEKFCDYMKLEFPSKKNKFIFVNNGVENINFSMANKKTNNIFTIISVGGGLKIKNNLAVCEAISKINNTKIKFIVIGQMGTDGEKIKKFSFVKYYQKLNHDDVIKKMMKSNLYIQNSSFETFGLSILEALSCGCDLLISKQVGALSILDNVNVKDDIIFNNTDVNEIKDKILKKIKNKNVKITYDQEKCNWKKRSDELYNILLDCE